MKYLHTMVRARDLDETLNFYCDKLGLVEVNRYDSEAGRFTLIFLAAPDDVEQAQAGQSPLLEITWNWDPESYDSGRNFGHLAYRVDNICPVPEPDGQRCHHQPATPGRPHGFHSLTRRHLNRTIAGR